MLQNEIETRKKKATKQLLILRYTVSRLFTSIFYDLFRLFVSRLRKNFVFLPSSDINMTFFSLYKKMHKTWFFLASQARLDNTKFLLTKKIKNKVSSNKR